MKNNKKGSALIVAMGLVILISILAISILNYIIPFSKNVKGIENSAGAYYNSTSAIENALWFINTNTLGTNSGTSMPTTATGYKYNIIAKGSILPPLGKGNSEFNKDWNKISSGNPIQLEVGDNKIPNWGTVKLYIRVPDIDGSPISGAITESFSGYNFGTGTGKVIQWQLSSKSGSLNPKDTDFIMQKNICDSNKSTINCIKIDLGNKQGIKLNGSGALFSIFYGNTITGKCLTGKSCILKLSVINKLEWKSGFTGGTLPYLEWKLNTGANTIPLRYTNIKASGKSFGFKKELTVKVPQKTTIDAFNFTIFQ